jgi:hypothetical protein
MRDPDRLYELLPAIYRERDEAEGRPLKALLGLISGQAELLHADIERLWDNFFIETCDRWAIPYIGDLVGNNPLHDAHRVVTLDSARALFPDLVGRDLRPPIAIRTRADVAKTIYYRRRKGTLPMLEELARDVTGWPAHAVEFFELLGWTQYVGNHLRMHRLGTPDIRKIEPVDRIGGAFDTSGHTVDVRRIGQLEGWYNIKNIGVFLWRLGGYPVTNGAARQVAQPWQYHFSPLGNPAPLFSQWRREGDEAGLATELHIPGPVRPAAFYEDLQRCQALPSPQPDRTDFYGPGSSFSIVRDGLPVAPDRIRCQDLSISTQPVGDVVAVDVRRGRIAFGTTAEPEQSVDVSYHYGFSADLGGGPYERGKWLVRPELAVLRLRVREGATPPELPTLGDALQAWTDHGKPNTVITMLDNRTYVEPVVVELADEAWLVIEASNGVRPHIQPDGGAIQIVGSHPGSALTLSGLLVEGGMQVTGDLGCLRLLHTTLVPGRGLDEHGDPNTDDPAVVVEGESSGEIINAKLRVEIAFSITGPIRLPAHARGLWLLDSIVDGLGGTAIADAQPPEGPGPPASMERVTVFGRCRVTTLPLASEVVFTEPVVAERRQTGCVRFSFVPHGSETPRRYRCQPDLEIATRISQAEKDAQATNTTVTASEKHAIRAFVRGWLVPGFTAMRYGLPGYAQLRLGCPISIRTGGEDGAEMGAFNHLKQPQRETNLRIRLDEYLPFGLDAGFLYVT